jgi:hypothetical protein
VQAWTLDARFGLDLPFGGDLAHPVSRLWRFVVAATIILARAPRRFQAGAQAPLPSIVIATVGWEKITFLGPSTRRALSLFARARRQRTLASRKIVSLRMLRLAVYGVIMQLGASRRGATPHPSRLNRGG